MRFCSERCKKEHKRNASRLLEAAAPGDAEGLEGYSAAELRGMGDADKMVGLNDVDDEWFNSWCANVRHWWLTIPPSRAESLANCFGALSLHLSSRLTEAYRGTFHGISTTPDTQRDSSSNTAEPGCEWLAKDESLTLPDFPAAAPSEFWLPPTPHLLPEPHWLESLVEMSTVKGGSKGEDAGRGQHELWEALEVVQQPMQRSIGMQAAAAGAAAGAGSALLLVAAGTIFSLTRKRQHTQGQACPSAGRPALRKSHSSKAAWPELAGTS